MPCLQVSQSLALCSDQVFVYPAKATPIAIYNYKRKNIFKYF